MHRVPELVRQGAETDGGTVEAHDDERRRPGRAGGERSAHLPDRRVDVHPAVLEAAAPDRFDVGLAERCQRAADPVHALLVGERGGGAPERSHDVVGCDPLDAVDPTLELPVAMPGRQVRLEGGDQVVEDRERDVRPRERLLEQGRVAPDARREDPLLDRGREVGRERVADTEMPVVKALPCASSQFSVGPREERIDRALVDRLLFSRLRAGRLERESLSTSAL